MVQCVSVLAAFPAAQARSILRAWVRQDSAALRQEFEKGLEMCRMAPCRTAVEQEQSELLEAVVSRLDGYVPSQADRDDPGVRLCIRLLEHLASQSERTQRPDGSRSSA